MLIRTIDDSDICALKLDPNCLSQNKNSNPQLPSTPARQHLSFPNNRTNAACGIVDPQISASEIYFPPIKLVNDHFTKGPLCQWALWLLPQILQPLPCIHLAFFYQDHGITVITEPDSVISSIFFSLKPQTHSFHSNPPLSSLSRPPPLSH